MCRVARAEGVSFGAAARAKHEARQSAITALVALRVRLASALRSERWADALELCGAMQAAGGGDDPMVHQFQLLLREKVANGARA